MACIGVTGHVHLPAGTADTIYHAVLDSLHRFTDAGVHGVTCLAQGADQIFARAILALGGTLEVVLPATDYRDRGVSAAGRADFDALLRRASRVSCMRFKRSGRRAYMAASEELLGRIEVLVAVWDGRPSRRLGDTADVVRAARAQGVPVMVVWPRKP